MKKFAVIGLGRFGFHASKALFEEGDEVLAIKQPPLTEPLLAPPADYTIQNGDILMLLGKTRAVEQVLRLE
ncbi:MAG: hypothetical protein ACOX5Z_08715 [Desulfobulbus sp.]|jgi:Trk K+ transport system NAD-binding subunit